MEPDLGKRVLNTGATAPHLGEALTGEQKEGTLLKLRVTFWPETLIVFRRDARGQ